eukprot:CAMPEP_0114545060 /NCGR_PEP_ID=MMETSP0114-20121206/3200_1 /TAXON_ID=31324 /ORGANISM="Goniomonas sp, Strain m" /LENGTH=334 /DNA_ID=CAMNT_0001729465 /DNA_START=4 /DNA_END=1005 /DNA_ORIENTATION=+
MATTEKAATPRDAEPTSGHGYSHLRKERADLDAQAALQAREARQLDEEMQKVITPMREHLSLLHKELKAQLTIHNEQMARRLNHKRALESQRHELDDYKARLDKERSDLDEQASLLAAERRKLDEEMAGVVIESLEQIARLEREVKDHRVEMEQLASKKRQLEEEAASLEHRRSQAQAQLMALSPSHPGANRSPPSKITSPPNNTRSAGAPGVRSDPSSAPGRVVNRAAPQTQGQIRGQPQQAQGQNRSRTVSNAPRSSSTGRSSARISAPPGGLYNSASMAMGNTGGLYASRNSQILSASVDMTSDNHSVASDARSATGSVKSTGSAKSNQSR